MIIKGIICQLTSVIQAIQISENNILPTKFQSRAKLFFTTNSALNYEPTPSYFDCCCYQSFCPYTGLHLKDHLASEK